jgi:SNF2 family DNA or RNA helicase
MWANILQHFYSSNAMILQFVVPKTMLRRMKDQIVNGRRLIDLPQKHFREVECVMGNDERRFHDAIQDRMKNAILTLINTLKANADSRAALRLRYAAYVLLLRMRQGMHNSQPSSSRKQLM